MNIHEIKSRTRMRNLQKGQQGVRCLGIDTARSICVPNCISNEDFISKHSTNSQKIKKKYSQPNGTSTKKL